MNKDKELEEAKKICDNLINVLGTGLVKFGEKIDLGSKENGYIQAIKTVLQALEKVTEERDIYLRQLNKAFDNGFISKKKIENKIEYLNDIKGDNTQSILNKIKVLQELLEGK